MEAPDGAPVAVPAPSPNSNGTAAAATAHRAPLVHAVPSEDEERITKADRKDSHFEETESAKMRVVLRIDVATKLQACLLTYSVFVLAIIFTAAALGLLLAQDAEGTLGDARPSYKAQLIIAAVCVLALLIMGVIALEGARHMRQEGRVWSARQTYFFETAAILLAMVFIYDALYLSSLAAVQAEGDCGYPWTALAILDFFRRISFAFCMLFLLVRLNNMSLWRGPGALDMDPDFMLIADRPQADRGWAHIWAIALWSLLVLAGALGLASKLSSTSEERGNFDGGCDVLVADIQCPKPALLVAGAVLSFVVVCIFLVFWSFYARRAMANHKQLPYCRYRETHIFLRVQTRCLGPVQVAMLMSVLLLELIPSVQGNCLAPVNAQIGNMSLALSLSTATIVLSILYTPTAGSMDSPLQQQFLQMFSWTEAEMPAELQRRNALLAAAIASCAADSQGDVLNQAFGVMRKGVGMLAFTQGADSAAAQLAKEPIFCCETAVRLFYWARLAYRDDEKLDYKFLNIATAMAQYGLEQWEKIHDPESDTHAVLAWSIPLQRAVIAFRGTKSVENVMTDIKAWPVLHLPERKYGGVPVKIHAGFYAAWLSGDFNKKVMKRLREIDDNAEHPMRFWVTGHSLGGALAMICTAELTREHPDSRITTYTYGCPRVFNKAGAKEFNAAVPDCWALINGTDPVAWIPKWGFKRVGQRVNLDQDGNLVLRPTYFELSVIQRGVNPKHHMTLAYAMSLATFFKNQFSASKRMRVGGPSGVTALCEAADVSRLLNLTNCDLESLKDPEKLIESTEKLEEDARKASEQGSGSPIKFGVRGA